MSNSTLKLAIEKLQTLYYSSSSLLVGYSMRDMSDQITATIIINIDDRGFLKSVGLVWKSINGSGTHQITSIGNTSVWPGILQIAC